MPEHTPGHLMLSEIRDQPAAIRRLIDAEFDRVWAMAERWQHTPPTAIFLAARGTSDHAALYAKYLIETMTGIPVGLASPSIASIYHAHVNVRGALLIGISQSGEAADVISVLEQADRDGADTLAITNVPDSPLTAAAHNTLLLHANPELSVAATKTFTCTLGAIVLLTAALGRNTALRDDLLRIPALLEKVCTLEPVIRTRIERFRYLEECVVLGRGYNLGTAYELALKLRETCYIRAQPFASPDFVHGPIAIIEAGYPVIAFANRGPSLSSVLEVIEQSQQRGAEAVVIGNAEEALAIADVAFPVNVDEDISEAISPFQAIMAGQFMAQAMSVLKGIDPDKPRGLRKVTITH